MNISYRSWSELVKTFTAMIVLLVGCSAFADSSESNVIRLYTEDFPPYSMTVDGSSSADSAENITGFMAEIVKELFSRAEIDYTMELVPWARAYENTLTQPNHGVFTTVRTEEREQQFSWITPLLKSSWVFVAKADANITLSNLSQASQYRIGGYYEDAIAKHLEGQGLRIDYVPNDVLNMRKLVRGRIDLWPVVQAKGIWMANSEGLEVEEVYTIMFTEMGLAMNKESDPELIHRLNIEMQSLKDDGTLLRIIRSYLGDEYELLDTAEI
ncbi:MAG: transporter substrate-binding domain-containing protein [Pseudomonadales bacterium]|nr:transporter substrate-binding domain-containing protein [Pseudomonadales bacterium]